MKMNKKGFTLIELLAVIVILAIIALIVTPVISNIITSAKKAANARSVEGYAKDIQIAIMSAAFENGELDLSAYDVNNGATLPAAVASAVTSRVSCTAYNISNGTVTSLTGCTVDGSTETYHYGETSGAAADTN